MLANFANIWWHRVHSFFDVTNAVPSISNLWNKQHLNMEQSLKVKNADVLLGYFILFWMILYLVYNKCLNLLLRRMCLPLMQRNRIIEAAWMCGFCFGSICYFKSFIPIINNFTSQRWEITHQELGVLLHRSFYFHHAGISLLYNGPWMKALADLTLALFILVPDQERSCSIINTFLFHKAVGNILINICQILVCVFQTTGRLISKGLFSLHCFNWIYLYIFFVPNSMMWADNVDYIQAKFGMWIWFLAECFDSVWLKLCGCGKATYWLEICIFPPPTRDTIELANIRKKQRSSQKSVHTRSTKKLELWQTLFYAMAIKKKIKRLRQGKEVSQDVLASNVEVASLEEESKKIVDEGRRNLKNERPE